jgi:hypothetical protein
MSDPQYNSTIGLPLYTTISGQKQPAKECCCECDCLDTTNIQVVFTNLTGCFSAFNRIAYIIPRSLVTPLACFYQRTSPAPFVTVAWNRSTGEWSILLVSASGDCEAEWTATYTACKNQNNLLFVRPTCFDTTSPGDPCYGGNCCQSTIAGVFLTTR